MRREQSIFARNVARLIEWGFENDIEFTFGEVYRTNSQQLLYYFGYEVEETNGNLYLVETSKKSKTMFSKHLNRLAVDLNIFINGKYIEPIEENKPKFAAIAAKWREFDERNESGYDWGWDFSHFQMTL